MSRYTDFQELWNRVCDDPQVPVIEQENPYEGFRLGIRHLTEDIGEVDGYISAVAETESFWNAMKEFGFSHSNREPVIDKVSINSAGELSEGMGLVFDTAAVTLDNGCTDNHRIVCVKYGLNE